MVVTPPPVHSLLSEGGECALGFPKIMVSKLLYSSAFSAEVKIRRRTAEPTGFPWSGRRPGKPLSLYLWLFEVRNNMQVHGTRRDLGKHWLPHPHPLQRTFWGWKKSDKEQSWSRDPNWCLKQLSELTGVLLVIDYLMYLGFMAENPEENQWHESLKTIHPPNFCDNGLLCSPIIFNALESWLWTFHVEETAVLSLHSVETLCPLLHPISSSWAPLTAWSWQACFSTVCNIPRGEAGILF